MLVPVTYGSGHLHPALAAFPARTGLDSEGGTKEPGVLPSERINSKPREEAGPRPHRSRQHGDGRCGGTSGSSQHRAFQRQPCIDEYPCDHMWSLGDDIWGVLTPLPPQTCCVPWASTSEVNS
ncbi:uncharacterized protein WM277_006559 isoform 1-T1 [Molossus nigricans]